MTQGSDHFVEALGGKGVIAAHELFVQFRKPAIRRLLAYAHKPDRWLDVWSRDSSGAKAG